MSRQPQITFYVKQRSISFALPLDRLVLVGRGADADLCVDEASVSRRHLSVLATKDGIEVADLGSSNGTEIFVAAEAKRGICLKEGKTYRLSSDDVIRLGDVPAIIHGAHSGDYFDAVTSPPLTSASRILLDPKMKRLYELAERAATSDLSVLIQGETGSGKELLAQHVHEKSNRRDRAFVQINCGALSETLLESELFGHEKGAFTGAISLRRGLLETASGGTLFLDEIGDMPLATQVKLLRVLEEHRIRRVGSSKAVDVDLRFVAATNRDLEEEVRVGRFRRDLYYRINGMVLHVPPLRERLGEIESLARHFLHQFCLRTSIAMPDLTPSALDALLAYPWPGNVRQLKNAIERAPLLSGGAPLTREHLPSVSTADADEADEFSADPLWPVPPTMVGLPRRSDPEIRGRDVGTSPRRIEQPRSAPPNAFRLTPPPDARTMMARRGEAPQTFRPERRPSAAISAGPQVEERLDAPALTHGNSKEFSERDERDAVIQALEACSGNQTRAAELLGVSRRTLISRIEQFGIPRPRKKSSNDELTTTTASGAGRNR